MGMAANGQHCAPLGRIDPEEEAKRIARANRGWQRRAATPTAEESNAGLLKACDRQKEREAYLRHEALVKAIGPRRSRWK